MKIAKDVISIGVYNSPRRQYLHQYTCKKCKQDFQAFYAERTKNITGFCTGCCNQEKWNKPVKLKFYNKPKIWEYESITEFCKHRTQTLGPTGKFHFAEVLNGKRLHYKGWMDADSAVKIDNKKVKIIRQTLLAKAVIR
jgi:hypothetical protein